MFLISILNEASDSYDYSKDSSISCLLLNLGESAAEL
jgi:hypothetical protein